MDIWGCHSHRGGAQFPKVEWYNLPVRLQGWVNRRPPGPTGRQDVGCGQLAKGWGSPLGRAESAQGLGGGTAADGGAQDTGVYARASGRLKGFFEGT